jgi:glycine dehydrogenase subunit 2
MMLTNPNTLGLFEEQIEEVVERVHACGGLVFGDGANMNALAGIVKPGELGLDLMHYNLHKTFSTPHGCGGPGSGPLGASEALREYLPGPVVDVEATSADGTGGHYVLRQPSKSIGRMCTYLGNFGMLIRAYAYIRLHGTEGLRLNSIHAVLNANYLRVALRDFYRVPFDRINMHEFVCEGRFEGSDVNAYDISKRLMDYGFHPPTNYFPLTVREALMIEPTETESRQTLDAFVEAMRKIAAEAVQDPARVRTAPHTTPVRRLDEVRAARHPVLAERLREDGPS